jgi:hypothetical protein
MTLARFCSFVTSSSFSWHREVYLYFYWSVTNKAQTSQSSTAMFKSPLTFAGMFHTTDLTFLEFAKWYFVGLRRRFCDRFSGLPSIRRVKGNLQHSQSLLKNFLRMNREIRSKVCVLPATMTMKAPRNKSCVSDAVFSESEAKCHANTLFLQMSNQKNADRT